MTLVVTTSGMAAPSSTLLMYDVSVNTVQCSLAVAAATDVIDTPVSVETIGGCEAAMEMCLASEILTVFRGHRVRVKMKQAVAEQRATECRTGAEPALTIWLSQPEAGMRTELTGTLGMETRLGDMKILLQQLPVY